MSNLIAMPIGSRWGFWEILRRAPSSVSSQEARWWCRCCCQNGTCTVRRIVSSASLRRGNSTSCGATTRVKRAWEIHRARLREISLIQKSLLRLSKRVAALADWRVRRKA
jgi:hypothetical protein